MPDFVPPGELRYRRKAAYYEVLQREEPDCLADLATLYGALGSAATGVPNLGHRLTHEFDWRTPERALALIDEGIRNQEMRQCNGWDDADTSRKLIEQDKAFRDTAGAIHAFQQRWRLPGDGGQDIVWDFHALPSNPAPRLQTLPVVYGKPTAKPMISLEPPPFMAYFSGPTDPAAIRYGASDTTALAQTAVDTWHVPLDATFTLSGGPKRPAEWALPFDPGPPLSEGRDVLERRLERLFAALRQQAVQQANALEASVQAHGFAQRSRSWEPEALRRGAQQLFLRAVRRMSWRVIADTVGASHSTVHGQVIVWAAELDILLP